MNRFFPQILTLFLAFFGIVISGCKQDVTVSTDALIIRISDEPDRINPILSRSSKAGDIEYLIFQPLAEFDPVTLEFTPVLLEEVPSLAFELRQDLGPVDRIDLKIKLDAKWPDGSDVTWSDVLFTFKVAFNPAVDAARFRSQLDFIKAERHDANDPKFGSFYLDTSAYLPEKIMTNFHMLPEYNYDSTGLLKDIPLNRILKDSLTESERKVLENFATQFESSKYSRDKIAGSGPYELTQWNTEYEIRLTKKSNWWGDKYKASNHFKAIPESIIYRFIPDEQLAVTALANDNVHLISNLNPDKYRAMQEATPDEYQFLNPVIPQYYYIVINNNSPLLNDRKTRQALAHLVNQENLVNVVMNGYGQAITAPILPDSELYDSSIKPYSFDVEKAIALLESAGWTDSDKDGILDKEIEGISAPLKLRLNITGGSTGRKIALLLKDQAKPAGIDIEIVTQKFHPNTMEDISRGDFELVAAAGGQSLLQANLWPNWHSQGHTVGGSNYAGYKSETMDSILDKIEIEENPTKRIQLYHEFHKQIHEDVPVLFLLMPQQRILVSKHWKAVTSARRPGYFVQLFEPTNL